MNLPRRPIEPILPPPDAFQRVVANARNRRRRTLAVATSAIALAVVASASFALGASLNVVHRLDPASSHLTSAPVTPGPYRHDSPTRKPEPGTTGGAGAGNSVGDESSWLRGRAVDQAGRGIAGLYVLPGSHGAFTSVGWSNARTNARGYYSIPCPHSPVLLATWRLNVPYAGTRAGGNWAATFVGSRSGAPVVPRCGGQAYETTLVPGATLTGKVIDSGNCVPGDNYHIWLYFRYHQTTAIRLHGLYSRDSFTVSGLPTGTYMLGLRMQMKKVTVAAGSTTEANVDFTCDGTSGFPKDGKPRPQVPSTPVASPAVAPSPTPPPETVD